ncbi:ribonuclease domain-containing protein (plasmid) [Bacillus mycoides]|uniref:ribonuclease domain-containing protein n=1 Tax=Bacillus mycoides TaxID=1405 RepID=UPI00292D7901|nr:ribonuclease domain-containing protein [Bacillus mycoides]WOA66686.1 ribonuclease domain-containing protein [Bacillus mycoides]
MGFAEGTCNYIRIGTGKEIGQLIKGEDVITGRKYGPEDYGWGTLSVVSGGTSRVIGKVVGKIGDLEKKGKPLEAAAKNKKFTKDQAESLGWVDRGGNLHKVAPGKSMGGDIFENRKKQLPDVPGRTWYEADINYVSGFRGNDRIVYSSDGLIYKTSDRYKTFTEIK